jgi:hypothetical protein
LRSSLPVVDNITYRALCFHEALGIFVSGNGSVDGVFIVNDCVPVLFAELRIGEHAGKRLSHSQSFIVRCRHCIF